MNILRYLGLISICCILFGCHTIRQEILGEKDQLTGGELQGIWEQKKVTPIIRKVAKQKTQRSKIKKWLQKVIEQTLEKVRKMAESTGKANEKNRKIQQAQAIDDSEFTNGDMSYFSPYMEEETIPLTRRTLFLEPGEEGKPATIEFYLPRRTPSRWKWIISPHVEANSKDPSQGLLEYVKATLIKNIENIQGKIGIVLEW